MSESLKPPGLSLKLKRTLQRGLHAAGLHVGKFPAVESQAFHLKTLFAKLEINCVLDVGAHEGEFAGMIRELGYTGRIVSFEPVRSSFDTISAKLAGDPEWTGRNHALGASEGELEMHLYKGSVFNSFLAASAYGVEHFEEALVEARKEVMPVRRLDAVLDECLAGLSHPRVFLKLDTQGWDLKVLEGAGAAIDRIAALQTELAAKPTYEGMPSFTDALAQLHALGFELTGIFPVARDDDELRVIEFDCVMLRVR